MAGSNKIIFCCDVTVITCQESPKGCISAFRVVNYARSGSISRASAVFNSRPWSWVHGLGSMVHGPWSMVHGLGSVVLGPWSWVHDLGSMVLGLWSMVLGPWSMDHGPWSWIYGLGSMVLGPWSWVPGLGTMDHGPWTMDPRPRTLQKAFSKHATARAAQRA